jgi:competence protein ComEA
VPLAQGVPQPKAKVDLNSADIDQLDELPGIGPTTAQRILDYREENGPFKRIEDLMEVKGIGEKKFLNLKELITVQSTPEPKPAGQ